MPILKIGLNFPLVENTTRITRDSLYINMCKLISLRSFCQRAKVGCIITSPDHRIISSGYNGTLQEACIGICDPHDKCAHAIHAEANAISFAAKNGIPLKGSILYCTHSPCYECAKLIVQAGINTVVYAEQYRLSEGIILLKEHQINVIHYLLP